MPPNSSAFSEVRIIRHTFGPVSEREKKLCRQLRQRSQLKAVLAFNPLKALNGFNSYRLASEEVKKPQFQDDALMTSLEFATQASEREEKGEEDGFENVGLFAKAVQAGRNLVDSILY